MPAHRRVRGDLERRLDAERVSIRQCSGAHSGRCARAAPPSAPSTPSSGAPRPPRGRRGQAAEALTRTRTRTPPLSREQRREVPARLVLRGGCDGVLEIDDHCVRPRRDRLLDAIGPVGRHVEPGQRRRSLTRHPRRGGAPAPRRRSRAPRALPRVGAVGAPVQRISPGRLGQPAITFDIMIRPSSSSATEANASIALELRVAQKSPASYTGAIAASAARTPQARLRGCARRSRPRPRASISSTCAARPDAGREPLLRDEVSTADEPHDALRDRSSRSPRPRPSRHRPCGTRCAGRCGSTGCRCAAAARRAGRQASTCGPSSEHQRLDERSVDDLPAP